MQLMITMLVYIIVLIPIWRIVGKMGYSAPVSILVFIPVVGLIALYVIAFRKWPIEKDYEHLLLKCDSK